jgi:hypothetical protein
MRRHLQGTGRELRVELLRGVDGDLGALTERSLQLPWVVRVAELGIVLDLVKVALPEFVRVRLLVPLVRALSLGGRDVVGEVLDGELAEAQGLVVVAAAAPAPGEASSGAPAAVVEPAALGRPRGRAAVVAVIAVERGSAAGGRAPALESAAAGTAAIIELLPGRGRTGRQRRSVHRGRSKIPEGRRSRSVRDGRDTTRRLRERGGGGHGLEYALLERRGPRDEVAKRVRALPICRQNCPSRHNCPRPRFRFPNFAFASVTRGGG